MKRGARLLYRNRVRRVLTPPEFLWWPILGEIGLQPVETAQLRSALAPAWVQEKLKVHHVSPEAAVLCLKGERLEAEMERVARELCPKVRNLVIDAPGGRLLAERLRREYGMPVLPGRWPAAHLTLTFDGGPVFPGVQYAVDIDLPEDCECDALLAALWEAGRISLGEITLKL